ncbi:MAG: acyl-CoA dehydrogenase C-terminal domain-containing protein, partial [Myxococcales bacterium]|nr:acyl-CoA dehydrogenase C-terminal domain-containing protein [Myxococcales bacterium]
EGTNHIQALDLVGRKLPMHGGRLLRVFSDEITNAIRDSAGTPEMAEFLEPLKAEAKRLTATTMELGGKLPTDPELLGAIASNYLNQFALVTLAYVWVREAKAALGRPDGDPVRQSKLQCARYYMQMVLPEAAAYAAKVAVGKGVVTDIDVDLL